jgi:hypothetical protein
LYYINRRFGHQTIFSKYLGLPNLVIPGEIQHGYWYDDKWKNYIRRHKLRRFYLWGGSFFEELTSKERRNTTCIGDPFLYFFNEEIKSKVLQQKRNCLLIPSSKSKTLSRSELLKYHVNFVSKYKKNLDFEGSISLHPNEADDHEILSVYQRHGIFPTHFSNLLHKDFYQNKIAEYRSHDLIFTDYLGPHVFRARLLGLTIVMKIESKHVHTRVIEISNLFDSLSLTQEIENRQFEVSKFELGYSNLVNKLELVSIFQARFHEQLSLRALFALKCKLLSFRNQLIHNQATYLAGNVFGNSSFECPHCYTLNTFSEAIKSQKCRDCRRQITL